MGADDKFTCCIPCMHYILSPESGECTDTCSFSFQCRFDGVEPKEDGSCKFFEPEVLKEGE